ncbi:sulfatase-like hydrolase/transferase [bacterium]|nr:sulfatase-like hydrolase/transferase [bacterium]
MPDKTKISAFLKKFLPRFDLFQVLSVIFFTVLNIIFLVIASQKNGFSITDADILFHFAVKLLFDAAFFLFSVLMLKAVFRIAFVPALYVAANATLAVADILLYYFGNTLVERSHFALITPYSVTSFVPWYGFAAIFAFVSAVFAVSFFCIRKIPKEDLFKKSLFWLTICISLNLLNISVSSLFDRDERFDRVITGFRNAQIYYVTQNQWIDFTTDVIFPALGETFKVLSPVTEKFVGDYRLFSDDFTVTNDFSPYRETIKNLDLNLGKNDEKTFAAGEYSRIIYIFAESLSLEALPCHNSRIEGDFANRFFCRSDIKARTFTNLTTSGSPTLQGLTVTFDSHPNYNIQEPTGHMNSLPKILKKHGYKPVFIRSASKFFANENLVFQNMGFSEIIGREDFFADENLKKYIYGWGLEDRILYEQVAEYLKKNRNEKLFVSILGTDTHPPAGQMKYLHLSYPQPPKIGNIRDRAAKLWLTSVDRMDLDIAAFIDTLDKDGLFDDSTLIVISADHSCPLNNVTAKIPGHPRNNLAKMPLIFLTKQPLPETDFTTLANQTDIAPTILHILGFEKPAGWWGQSLFAEERKEKAIGFDKKFLYLSDKESMKTINTEKPADASEQAVIDLFNTVFTERRP